MSSEIARRRFCKCFRNTRLTGGRSGHSTLPGRRLRQEPVSRKNTASGYCQAAVADPRLAGGAAAVLAMIAFLTGSACFTPSAFLLLFAFPLAILALYRAAWRTGAFALYWIAAAVIVSPIILDLPIRVDYWLVALGVAGFVLGLILYANYRRMESAA